MRTATGMRVLAILLVVILTAVMVRLALRPAWPGTLVQWSFLLGVVGFGWLGGVGIVTDRFTATIVGATGLFLLGFWQATLWVVMVPTAVVLAIAGAMAHLDVLGRE